MALCKKLLDAINWPTLLIIYGDPGSGKTNLALEFVKYYCISSCLYISNEIPPVIERVKALRIRLEAIDLKNVMDYMDLIDALLRSSFHKYDLVVIDPINAFAREKEIGYRVTLFALAALRHIHDTLGLPIILTAIVHTDPERNKSLPVAENAVYFWGKSILRVERVGDDIRKVLVEKPKAFEGMFKILRGGIEWVTC